MRTKKESCNYVVKGQCMNLYMQSVDISYGANEPLLESCELRQQSTRKSQSIRNLIVTVDKWAYPCG